MGIAQRLRALDARLSRYATDSMKAGIGYPNPGWAPPPGHVGMSVAGVAITEDRANTVSAWFAGIRNISEDVATAPLHVYRRAGRNAEKAVDSPVYRLLHDAPNPEMTSFTFRSVLQAHAMAWGNGYAEKELNGSGRTVALWPLRPDRMEVFWEDGRRVYEYRPTATAQPVRLKSERVFHLPGLGFDGLRGYPILALARETLGTTVALREYGARVLANDARPSIALTHPGVLSDPARQHISDSWNATYGGFTNAGRAAILEEGISIQAMGFPPEDIQFLESQKWQVAEIARWLRIAPHKIGDLERATFSNIEEQNIDHVTSTLRAWFVRWEQQLDKDVIADPALYCEHNMDALMRGKTLERAQANTLKINAGAMTPNEWRAQDNQNPLPWGDERVNTPNNAAPLPDGSPSAGKAQDVVVINTPPAITIAAPEVKNEVRVDSVTLADERFEALREQLLEAQEQGRKAVGDQVAETGEALASAVAAVGGLVRDEIRSTEADRAAAAERAAATPLRRRFIRDAEGRIVAFEEEADGVKRRTDIVRDAAGELQGTVTS